MAYHFEEETDAATQLSVVNVFLVPESGSVGIVQGYDIKIQLLCLGPLKLHVE